eukprot:TRINITY_DN26427_c0_g1_i1.p2 TRINITY_DN26427_c0_g1~~TRINITY_DN26427_c0_g1_i1.p2  ORF type:complete len:443 (-),score=112.64 TRINITY_DN26427_c0_g1_i1:54-1382(-)
MKYSQSQNAAPITAASPPVAAAAGRRPLLALKLWYLFYFGAQFTQLFLPLILAKEMHFAPSVIGYLMAARRIIIFVGAPLFTWLCDVTLQHRTLLIIAHSAYYMCTLWLSQSYALRSVLAVIVLRELCVSGCEPTVNNAALATLQETPQQQHSGYGVLRLWGSVGWGVASVLGPYVASTWFDGNLRVILYTQVLIGAFVLYLVAFQLDLSRQLFQRQTLRKQMMANGRSNAQLMRALLRSAEVMYCMAAVFIQGVVLGVFQTTVFLYFSALGVDTRALGLSVLLSCGAEAVSFLNDSWFWRTFGGAQAGFDYGLLMSSLTMMCYCLVQFAPRRALAFVVVEVMNGGTYALFLSSALQMANQVAPSGMSSTAQGVLSALLYGVGPAVGALLSGVAYERVGAPVVYCALAAVQMMMLLARRALRLNLERADERERERGEMDSLL